MISPQEFQQLKDQVERATSEQDRDRGALDELKKQAKKDFGVKSLKECRELIEKLDKEEKNKEREFRKAQEEFDNKWSVKIL